jgi:Fe-S oxidoreductase/nitrate reductase gamma subunit
MESTREIFWNVGRGAAYPMYLFAFMAVAAFVWGFWRRLSVYRQGRSLNRFDGLFRRIGLMIRAVFTQTEMLRVRVPGTLHAFFFWSFGVLFVGTILIMVQIDLTEPLFNIVFLKGGFYKAFSLILDMAGLIAFIMLGGLLIRRFVLKPEGLITIVDDTIIHSLLILIILSGFIVEGLRMAATEIVANTTLAMYSPVGYLIGQFFLGMNAHDLSVTHKALWWGHCIFALGFIAIIPFTKLRHIFTASLNTLFTDSNPKGALATIHFDGNRIEEYGAGTVKDLTWKDIYDTDACTSCKRCQDRCPAYLTNKPLSPMKVVQQIGNVAFTNPGAGLRQELTEDVLWSCTTCRACQEICPCSIEHIGKIIDIRRNTTLMESMFPPEYKQIYKNLEIFGDSMGKGKALREEWVSNLKIKRVYENDAVDVVFWTGCMGPLYDERSRNTLAAAARVLEKAGIRFGILGKEEVCCGDIARRTGNEYLFQQMVKQNIELFKKYHIRKIVTNCPHCFNTLKNEYPQFGADVEVLSLVELTEKLLQEGLLRVTSKMDEPFTYHDPCYLGRYNAAYAGPRSVLRRILDLNLKEMDRSKEESFCCGAGGGNIWRGKSVGRRIEEVRIEEAVKTGANGIITACPYCEIMFTSAVKQLGMEYSFRVADIMELVDHVTIRAAQSENIKELTI